MFSTVPDCLNSLDWRRANQPETCMRLNFPLRHRLRRFRPEPPRLQLTRLREELERVVAEASAGRLTGPEARECLRSLAAEAPDGGRAAAALTGLTAGADSGTPSGIPAGIALRKVSGMRRRSAGSQNAHKRG